MSLKEVTLRRTVTACHVVQRSSPIKFVKHDGCPVSNVSIAICAIYIGQLEEVLSCDRILLRQGCTGLLWGWMTPL